MSRSHRVPELPPQTHFGSVSMVSDESFYCSGYSISQHLQSTIEPLIGIDLSSVSIHTDAQANILNHEFQSLAFTTGKDIFFRQGQYQPDSVTGQKLLIHELAHVAQQQQGRGSSTSDLKIQRKLTDKKGRTIGMTEIEAAIQRAGLSPQGASFVLKQAQSSDRHSLSQTLKLAQQQFGTSVPAQPTSATGRPPRPPGRLPRSTFPPPPPGPAPQLGVTIDLGTDRLRTATMDRSLKHLSELKKQYLESQSDPNSEAGQRLEKLYTAIVHHLDGAGTHEARLIKLGDYITSDLISENEANYDFVVRLQSQIQQLEELQEQATPALKTVEEMRPHLQALIDEIEDEMLLLNFTSALEALNAIATQTDDLLRKFKRWFDQYQRYPNLMPRAIFSEEVETSFIEFESKRERYISAVTYFMLLNQTIPAIQTQLIDHTQKKSKTRKGRARPQAETEPLDATPAISKNAGADSYQQARQEFVSALQAWQETSASVYQPPMGNQLQQLEEHQKMSRLQDWKQEQDLSDRQESQRVLHWLIRESLESHPHGGNTYRKPISATVFAMVQSMWEGLSHEMVSYEVKPPIRKTKPHHLSRDRLVANFQKFKLSGTQSVMFANLHVLIQE